MPTKNSASGEKSRLIAAFGVFGRHKQKSAAREALDEHRTRVFPRYRDAINKYLGRFGAGFSIGALKPADPRGIATSEYDLVVNQHDVPLVAKAQAQPSFCTTLSSGDRNTLALTFFFAKLEEEDHLDDLIIPIDDPASSLDDGRRLTTAQEIRRIAERAKQTIVLSHSRPLLCQVWEHVADRDSCATLMVRNVDDVSTIVEWNVSEAAITQYDEDHQKIRDFVTRSDHPKEAARAFRPVLEGFLRHSANEYFPPGWTLGQFIGRATDSEGRSTAIMPVKELEELSKLNEYANLFQHDTNPDYYQSDLANMNETQIMDFAKRVRRFTTKFPLGH